MPHWLKKIAYLPKPPYRTADIGKLDPSKPGEAWTAKIDGAHTVVELNKGKTPKLFSHRISKRTGKPIEYTGKLPHIKSKSPHTGILRGETYAVDSKGRAVHPDVVTSILNSGEARSKALQQAQGLITRTALIDVDKIDNKKSSHLSFAEKRKFMEEVAAKNPNFTLPSIAYTPLEKKKLLKEVKSGRHPETKEGLVVHQLDVGKPFAKAKITADHDVYVRRIFPEVSPTGRKPMAGGIEYSWEPGGEPVGKVGTGFDHAEKVDMLLNPEKYLGRCAKIKAHDVSKNKVLVKPSFIGWHVEKNLDRPTMAKQTVIVSKQLAADRQKAKGLAKMWADRLYTSRETGPSYRFRQIPPDKFVPGTFRTFKPKEGISIVYGQLKEASMFVGGFVKSANVLTSAVRGKIKPKNFALPGRRYPIENPAHARNALARVSQFGSPAEKAAVRAKVHKKYPGIGR
jgi:hypothetical protein